MNLEHILLALLAQPASGYDLKRAFDSAINFFWAADIAQIYRTLQRMEDKGLVKSKEVPSDQGPTRKVYRRTAKGQKQLFQWLRSEPEFGPERRASVAQLVFLGQLDDPEETLRFLIQMRDQLTSRLAVLKHIEAIEPELDPMKMNEEDFHGFMGLQMGIRTTASRIESVDESIAWVKQRSRKRNRDKGSNGEPS